MQLIQIQNIFEKKVKLFFINLIALSSTIPFVAIFPLDSDIQYPIFVLSGLVVLIDIFYKKFSLIRLEIYFAGLAILSFFYINPLGEFDFRITKVVGLSCGFLVFYVFRRYWVLMNPKVIIFGIYLNALIVLIEVISFEIYLRLVSPFVRVVKADYGGLERGFHGLMAEPSFLGGMAAFFFLISYALHYEKRISNLNFFFLAIISFVLMVFSKSITSVIFLIPIIFLSIFIIKITNLQKILLIFLTIIISIIIVIFIHDSNIRSVDFLMTLILNPQLLFDLKEDLSIASRLISLITAGESLIQGNIFGNGIGSMQFKSFYLLQNSKIFDTQYSNIIYFAGGFISAISLYIIELGLFFIILIAWLYSNTSLNAFNLYIRSISFLYILFTFSIVFPPFWALIAITDKFNRKE